MTTATLNLFETTIQKTVHWIDEVQSGLQTDNPQHAYRALRAVLMALRDRLTVEEATDLGAQLPMLIRGFYYEQWNPAKTPTRERSKAAFLLHVADLLQDTGDIAPEQATRAVFEVLEKHVTPGEIQHVVASLPAGIRELWP